MIKKIFFKNFLWIFTGIMISGCQRETMELSWETGEEIASEEISTEESVQKTVFVHICGAVKSPGVYELPVSSRIIDAINAAGGFLDHAVSDQINLAAVLKDGDQIRIYTDEELETAAGSDAKMDVQMEEGIVDLNSAQKEQLMELPGIGETKAEAILSYREEVGRFQTIEDLKNVSGIKESVFEKIKDKIIVR